MAREDILSAFDEDCLCVLPEFGDDSQNSNCPTCLEEAELCDWLFDCEGETGEAKNVIAGYQSPEDDELINMTAITTWLSNNVSNTGVDKIRHLEVVGGKTSGDPTVINGAKRKKFIGDHVDTYTLEVFPLCQKTRYGLMRMQKGGTFPSWFKSIGGGFYGGECGIPVSIVSVKFDHESGEGTYTKAVVVLEVNTSVEYDRDFYDVAI